MPRPSPRIAGRSAIGLIFGVFVAAAVPHGWTAVAERVTYAAAAWPIAESAGREAARAYARRATNRRP